MFHLQVCLPRGPPILRQACSCRRYRDTLGNDGDTALRNVEATRFIGLRINPDLGIVIDCDVLVQDCAMNDCVATYRGMGQDHRLVDRAALVYLDLW